MALAQQVNKSNAPCLNCTERHLRCHDSCDRYKAFKADEHAKKEYLWKYIGSKQAIAGKVITRSLKKNRR